jgi:tetratricopeptide (TPR) repeat protein
MNIKINTLRLIGHLAAISFSESECHKLISGEWAIALRNDQALTWLANQVNSPVSEYLAAVRLIQLDQLDQAANLLQPLLLIEPLAARTRLTLGAIYLKRGDIGTAELYYREASVGANDPLTACGAIKMRAVTLSLRNRHDDALTELSRGSLLLRSLPPSHPGRLDFLNSLGVELLETGHTEIARAVINQVIVSPSFSSYPEWQETASDERLQQGAAAVPVSALPSLGRLIPFPPSETIVAERLMQLRYKGASACMHSSSSEYLDTVLALGKANSETVHALNLLLGEGGAKLDLACRAGRISSEMAKNLSRLASRYGRDQDRVRVAVEAS